MMVRKKKEPDPQRVVAVPAPETQSPETDRAFTIINPSVRAGVTVERFSQIFGESDLGALIGELRKQSGHVHNGSLKRAETMLIAQAHTLDAIFNELARRSALNMGEYINAAERYLRLALKAQSQCRATLETLSNIKNPPVLYAKQANIANGPQQVNNAIPNPAYGKTEIEQNELLEHRHGQRLDSRTQSETSRVDTELEAVGKIDRAKNN